MSAIGHSAPQSTTDWRDLDEGFEEAESENGQPDMLGTSLPRERAGRSRLDAGGLCIAVAGTGTEDYSCQKCNNDIFRNFWSVPTAEAGRVGDEFSISFY